VIALTIAAKKGSLESMKRASKTLLAGVLVLAFALGLTCAAWAAPGNSVNRCLQISQSMDSSDCNHSAYVCPFAAARLFSPGLPRSFRSTIGPDGTDDFRRFEITLTSPIEPTAGIRGRAQDAARMPRTYRISARLFNSVLNL